MTDEENQLMRALWDALHEAAYEYCFRCHQFLDETIHDGCGKVCHYPKTQCFVRKWLNVLQESKKIFESVAENQKAGE